ncbi:MAG: PcfJ domain-containing protein, partial [Lachnospiraceae bacterium]|nr:PcfJ domain-containing protein [Lachnospiraceae bacterium]
MEDARLKEITPTYAILPWNANKEAIPKKVDKYNDGWNGEICIVVSVIGECLVYRIFDVTTDISESEDYRYGYVSYNIKSANEKTRYVFYQDIVIKEYIEEAEHKNVRELITFDRECWNMGLDVLSARSYAYREALFCEFRDKVDLVYKNEIINAMSRYNSHRGEGLEAYEFIEWYIKATTSKSLSDDIPGRIMKELKYRAHKPHTSVRIDKDLVVVVGEILWRANVDYSNGHRYYGPCLNEQTRAYLDKNNCYLFKQNCVTGVWELAKASDYIHYVYGFEYERPEIDIDKDILYNTCMEKYLKYSIDERIPNRSKVKFGLMIAQDRYLCVEQACKVNSTILTGLLNCISEGEIMDGNMSLPELLGITGAQLKYLEDIDIPFRISPFIECIKSEAFKSAYPDVKKRLFAASVCADTISDYDEKNRQIIENIIEAAPTISVIERFDNRKRCAITRTYLDYMDMRRRYILYVKNMRPDDRFRDYILAAGNFPLNMKPSRIRDFHNKLMRVMSLLDCAKNIDEYTERISERYKVEAKNWQRTNGIYSIIMPKNAEDIVREGSDLQHCVGRAGYIAAMAKNRTTILFLRENANINKSLLTLEVRDGKIMQC